MLDRLALHATTLKANQAIGHGRERGIVRDDDDRNALLAAGILQQLQDLLTGFIVERARGLVAQKQLGVLCQCAAEDTRCCSPPESCAGKLPRRSPRPT